MQLRKIPSRTSNKFTLHVTLRCTIRDYSSAQTVSINNSIRNKTEIDCKWFVPESQLFNKLTTIQPKVKQKLSTKLHVV